MKKIEDFTDAEKIILFDKMFENCFEEWESAKGEEEYDEHYFWEGMMEDVLGVTAKDYEDFNSTL